MKLTLGKLFMLSVMSLAGIASILSCTRESLPAENKFNVSVLLDTKALNLNEVQDIVIFVFAQAASGNGYLTGYLYDDQPNSEGIFPITLTEAGAMDFYVILNPNSNSFELVDQNGEKVDIGNEPDPGITPEDIRSWKIMYSASAPQDMSKWQIIPMSNLDGTSFGNRRFNIEAKKGWQTVPISVVRAVSKVEVWFRSDNDTDNNYWGINSLESSDPVKSTGAFIESTDHMQSGETPVTFTDDGTYYFDNTSFPANADKSDYYSEKNFAKIFEYYILPNSIGGNNAGEISDGTSTANYTSLKVDYFHHISNGLNPYSLTVYLPTYQRNTCIRVWCPLNNYEDNSFTYTVVDWDETVTVNIPDFS